MPLIECEAISAQHSHLLRLAATPTALAALPVLAAEKDYRYIRTDRGRRTVAAVAAPQIQVGHSSRIELRDLNPGRKYPLSWPEQQEPTC